MWRRTIDSNGSSQRCMLQINLWSAWEFRIVSVVKSNRSCRTHWHIAPFFTANSPSKQIEFRHHGNQIKSSKIQWQQTHRPPKFGCCNLSPVCRSVQLQSPIAFIRLQHDASDDRVRWKRKTHASQISNNIWLRLQNDLVWWCVCVCVCVAAT